MECVGTFFTQNESGCCAGFFIDYNYNFLELPVSDSLGVGPGILHF